MRHALLTRWAGVLSALALLASPAGAQPRMPPGMPSPRIVSIFPAGGRAGTTVEVSVAGTDLDEPVHLVASVPSLKAETIELIGPPNPKPTPENMRGPAGNPLAITRRRFRLTIPADASIGIHDVRLVNDWGVSNPRAFAVDDLQGVAEQEPNNDAPEAQRVHLPSAIDGVISTATDIDDFVFVGKKGQRVIASLLTTSLDSRLLAGVEIYAATGRRLAAGREYQGFDALADATLPADGDYLVRVHEYSYMTGGLDHFYRLSLSTAPWIDAVFPPAIEPGKSAHLVIHGRNLPGGRPDPSAVVDGHVLDRAEVDFNPPGDPTSFAKLTFGGLLTPAASGLDGLEFRVRTDSGVSNPALLTLATVPVTRDRGGNDTPDKAQEVEPPCEIAGRIEARGDRDWYAFAAKKGEVLGIEAIGDRLGAPIDLVLSLRDAATGKVLGEYDDGPPALSETLFFSRTDDPARIKFVAPAAGRYQLLVSAREAAAGGGPRLVYRVRIAPERPDFRLVVLPRDRGGAADCVLGRGGRLDYAVFAWRIDGMDGPIRLSAEGLPPGVSCPPQVLGSGQRQGSLVLEAGKETADWVGPIVVKGAAEVGGVEVVREARSASVIWPAPQANLAAVSRLDRGLMLAVRGEAPFRLTPKVGELAVIQGAAIKLPVAVERSESAGAGKVAVQINAPDLPTAAFANFAPLTAAPGKSEVEATLTAKADAIPGVYSVVFRGVAQVPFGKGEKDAPKSIAVSQPATPVALTVLPKQLAKLTVQPGEPKAKAGESAEVAVKVARQFDYAGPFRVELVIPGEAKGIEADGATIPAGGDEAKLVIKVAPEAARGSRPVLLVRATALFLDKTPIVQEVQFPLNVSK